MIHGYIMGMIVICLVFEITCGKRDRRLIITLGCGMLSILTALDWKMETALVLICALAATGVSIWCFCQDKGKADEDYAAFLEDDFDRAWFDVVIEGIGGYPVLFLPDMGSHKRDLLPGRIVEVGRGLHHKHRGVAVAKIEVSSGFYLCLLSGMVPNPSIEVPGIG